MPDRVEKHQSACTKQKKTRAVFNSTAARVMIIFLKEKEKYDLLVYW